MAYSHFVKVFRQWRLEHPRRPPEIRLRNAIGKHADDLAGLKAQLDDVGMHAMNTPIEQIPVLIAAGLSDTGQSHGDILAQYNIDAVPLLRWIEGISEGYRPNPYHNWRHAWDVFQLVRLSIVNGLGRYLAHDGVLSVLLAAVSHDVGHFGLTNPHLIAARDPLALTYNDESPLESLHAATFFHTLMRPGHNFLAPLSGWRYSRIRSHVVKAILATDMKHHFAHTAKLVTRVEQKDENPFQVDTITKDSEGDRALLQEMIVHFADVGNCVRPWPVYKGICALLEQEFFLQGDKERREGLPVAMLMNRDKDSLGAAQAFWIPKIVFPLLQPFQQLFFESFSRALQENGENNQAQWAALIAKHGKLTANELVRAEFGEEGVPKADKRLKEAAVVMKEMRETDGQRKRLAGRQKRLEAEGKA
jgi:hypothetical protein